MAMVWAGKRCAAVAGHLQGTVPFVAIAPISQISALCECQPRLVGLFIGYVLVKHDDLGSTLELG